METRRVVEPAGEIPRPELGELLFPAEARGDGERGGAGGSSSGPLDRETSGQWEQLLLPLLSVREVAWPALWASSEALRTLAGPLLCGATVRAWELVCVHGRQGSRIAVARYIPGLPSPWTALRAHGVYWYSPDGEVGL